MGPRIGVNAGYKYGREFGTYDTKSVYDIASEGHVDIMIGFSRFALIVTHGTFNLILDKTQDRLNATEWGARLSYALTPYFSVNGGTMLMTDTTFMRNNLPSLVGSDGLRLLVGADFFIWQNWLINFGLKLDVSYGGSEAPFADGTTESYNGGTVMFQPYFTLL